MQISRFFRNNQINLLLLRNTLANFNPRRKFFVVGDAYGNHITISSRSKRGAMRKIKNSVIVHHLTNHR